MMAANSTPIQFRAFLARALQFLAYLVLLAKSMWLPLATAFDQGQSHLGFTGHIEVDVGLNIFAIVFSGLCLGIGCKLMNAWKIHIAIFATFGAVLILQSISLFLKWHFVLS